MRPTTGRGSLLLLATLLFAAAVVTAGLAADATLSTAETPVESAIVGVKLAVLVVPTLGLLAIARNVDETSAESVLEWGILVGVSVAATAAVTDVHVGDSSHSAVSVAVSVLTAMNVGCLLGVLIGTHAADAAENARLANERRDDFVFLNRLLRHHLLNAVTIIRGRAGLVEDEVDDEAAAHVRAIRERSDHVASLVETVQTISNALSENTETTRVDVGSLVRDIAGAYQDATPETTIEVDVPPNTYVESNGSLRVVFDHLVENAIEHNDVADPFVRVTASERADVVDVRVVDNGSGFPERVRTTAFEPGDAGDSAIGLYAVGVIVDDCGGSVDIAEAADRTEVVVTLPKATPST
ncbi:HAMP domain-containing sensor histidine kinase [Salarchaeum sp. JOR-1]|uniref:sensor histidine kinase n=1 Tax=Salarchaeum sp. JOR-1 TaxID=2599399 RepID=UPI00143D84B6|nr:HAMP domain-containing sensor histidine kinase [Salarchaeum sp. JOR-1]